MGSGQCVVNPSALQKSTTGSGFMDAWERGAETGRRRRMQREEHEARLALIQAQTDAAQAQAEPRKFSGWADVARKASEEMRGIPVYSCDGKQTIVPEVGCVVLGFQKSP